MENKEIVSLLAPVIKNKILDVSLRVQFWEAILEALQHRDATVVEVIQLDPALDIAYDHIHPLLKDGTGDYMPTDLIDPPDRGQ